VPWPSAPPWTGLLLDRDVLMSCTAQQVPRDAAQRAREECREE
jgi:hypothetical protein